MSHPHRNWNEGLEYDDPRRNRRDDEQRWDRDREREPQRFGEPRRFDEWQRPGRPQRDDDFGFDSPGRRFGGDFAGDGERSRSGRYDEAGRYDEDRGFAGRGPKNYKRSDQRIQEDICERLTSDPRIDASEIQVEVKNGEVTLEGSVAERAMKRRAEDCAEYVSGVNQVHNRLRVAAPGQAGQGGHPSGSESWARAGSEQRADQLGTGRPGRIA